MTVLTQISAIIMEKSVAGERTRPVKRKILIAEDEKRIRILLHDFLEDEGYEVLEAPDGEKALEIFSASPGEIHLVILDIMMPLLNGWEVCRAIRRISKVPVFMLTAKNQDDDELEGFQSGTDEYIRKPFNPMLLVARVNAMMERVYGDSACIQRGVLVLDTEKRQLTVEGNSVELSRIEFNLLGYLIANERTPLSREQILNHVWGVDYQGSDRTVDTHMNRLRTKIGEKNDYINTVWGYGYKFEVTP